MDRNKRLRTKLPVRPSSNAIPANTDHAGDPARPLTSRHERVRLQSAQPKRYLAQQHQHQVHLRNRNRCIRAHFDYNLARLRPLRRIERASRFRCWQAKLPRNRDGTRPDGDCARATQKMQHQRRMAVLEEFTFGCLLAACARKRAQLIEAERKVSIVANHRNTLQFSDDSAPVQLEAHL